MIFSSVSIFYSKCDHRATLKPVLKAAVSAPLSQGSNAFHHTNGVPGAFAVLRLRKNHPKNWTVVMSSWSPQKPNAFAYRPKGLVKASNADKDPQFVSFQFTEVFRVTLQFSQQGSGILPWRIFFSVNALRLLVFKTLRKSEKTGLSGSLSSSSFRTHDILLAPSRKISI